MFQFDVILEFWSPGVFIYLKIDHLKRRDVALAGNDGKTTSRSNFKLRFSERSSDLVRGFYFEFDVI